MSYADAHTVRLRPARRWDGLDVRATLTLTSSLDDVLATDVMLVVALQIFVIGSSMAGPLFNAQLGILFWTAAAGLYGAANGMFNGPASSARRDIDVL